MEVIPEQIGHRGGGATIAMLLALLSSAGSIAIAGVGGWQRGTVYVDHVMFAGVSVLSALAAQFLPTLAGRVAALKRTACLGLWLVCMASTALTHAWYLLAAQERAGASRAEAFQLSVAPAPPSRERSAILSDRADVGEQLARLLVRSCDGACNGRKRIRQAALEDRLAALDAEAQAAVDTRQFKLRRQEQQQSAREDFVGSRLASSLQLSYSMATWVMALTYALILEGVGCLCWAVVLRVERTVPPLLATNGYPSDGATDLVSESVHKTALESNAPAATFVKEPPSSNETRMDSLAPISETIREDVVRVTEAVRDSTINLTVPQVRRFLKCSQARAQQVRRLVSDTKLSA